MGFSNKIKIEFFTVICQESIIYYDKFSRFNSFHRQMDYYSGFIKSDLLNTALPNTVLFFMTRITDALYQKIGLDRLMSTQLLLEFFDKKLWIIYEELARLNMTLFGK